MSDFTLSASAWLAGHNGSEQAPVLSFRDTLAQLAFFAQDGAFLRDAELADCLRKASADEQAYMRTQPLWSTALNLLQERDKQRAQE